MFWILDFLVESAVRDSLDLSFSGTVGVVEVVQNNVLLQQAGTVESDFTED